MKAIVTQEFIGRPDGEAMARQIKVGEELTGDLAEVAVHMDKAEPADAPKRGKGAKK